jgi:hypothetical protein
VLKKTYGGVVIELYVFFTSVKGKGKGKGEGKFHLRTGHEGPEGE